MPKNNPFFLERHRLQQLLETAAANYDKAALLQREIGQRMIERLDLIKQQPDVVVDLGCATGITTSALLKKYRKAQIVALEGSLTMLRHTRKRAPLLHKPMCLCGDSERLPLADTSCDLIFSNLTLPWCNDLNRVFAEFWQVLKPGGLVMFSTLGPDTLIELRHSWTAADEFIHVHGFFDMHDIGDALVHARLADPVMDTERITMTYPSVKGLLKDLKTLGATNIATGRSRGLTGKGKLKTMLESYEQFRRDGLIPATFEVVYGHAWKPVEARSYRQSDGTVAFPISRLSQKR